MPERKIALVLSSVPEFGGGFNYSGAVLQGLAQAHGRRFEVEAYCLNEEWEKLARTAGLVVHRVRPMSAPARKLRRALLLARALPVWRALRRRLSPLACALQASGARLAIFPCEQQLSLDSPVPALAPVHDLMYRYEARFPEVGRFHVRRIRLAMDRMVAREAAGVLVDSPTGAQQAHETLALDLRRAHVLPYVSARGLSAELPPRPPGVPECFVFYPAQFWSHKNHVGLLQALAQLRSEGLVVPAVFTGAPKNHHATVRATIEQLGLDGQVTNLGFVSDEVICALYRHATALVMPTFFGPTNIPPLEAMSLDCPVAISDIYGMREQLGDAALYFNPADPRTIAGAVRRLWTEAELRAQLIERGRVKTRQWNPTKFHERLAEVVAAILEGQSAVPTRSLR